MAPGMKEMTVVAPVMENTTDMGNLTCMGN